MSRRALGANHPLARQIASDRDALDRVMQHLQARPSALKVTVVRAAEGFGRLKPNGKFFVRSPLSDVIELETLVVGVRGKEALWTALRQAGVSVEGVDLGALVTSAREQGAELETLRLSATARAFATPRSDVRGSRTIA